MAKKNKTTQTTDSVNDFINSVADETKRADSFRIIELMKEQTGFEPKMWGPGIVGFGSYHYKYASGHEGDAPLAGFSPRKNAITLYLMLDADKKEKLMEKFGKHKGGKGCIYVQKLNDINIDVFKELIVESVKYMKSLYPGVSRGDGWLV